ncbi:hypothetical protein SAMN05880501_11698 [Ureibacillus xyleni]|uniref:Nephrocystin 3-like N-terminal domain-containing protein n=1 Tax=Ureibacillus xyleni TaxID=614648 RepID=A0A285TN20_9BACL|nr:hypothetical protein [Ureibacillus xyleni]SOC24129.1 hypothetical protein SAMN05880501_11698 [Ureibacillus xyleni]
MTTCPKCHSNLEEFKGKLICSNGSCDYISLVSEVQLMEDIIEETWYEAICNNETYWYQQGFETYPSVISHEYWRLYDMLKQGQIYGAILQLKDVFEVLIKFPTLYAASAIYNRIQRSDVENKIILSLLDKQLSLGHWKQIAQTIVKKVNIPYSLKSILTNIVKIYEDIPSWRNENIGHGALTLDEEKLKMDISEKLLVIKAYLEENQQSYDGIHFIVQHNQDQRVLNGKDHARKLPETSGELFAGYNGMQHKLYPYILLEDGNIYFFDSFNKYDYKTSLINYPEGVKQNFNKQLNKEMQQIYLAMSTNTTRSELQEEHSLEDESYSLMEEEIIHKIQEVDDFQKPAYLEDWIKQLLNEHEKGVFLLQMERGTGKTTFSKSLDEHSIHAIKISGASVRCHYINDSYSYKINHFLMNVTDRLRMSSAGRTVISSYHHVPSGAEDKKRAFAKSLNEYQKEHQKYLKKEKLLFIIDGLDEIPSTSNESIFDYIPTGDMLGENVFILLTSRTKNEVSMFVKNRMNGLQVDREKTVSKDQDENVKMLREYVKKHIFKENNSVTSTQQEEMIRWMLTYSEHRFIYLKLLKELYSINQSMNRMMIPQGADLFDYYFDTLKTMYGEKFFKNIVRLIAILSTSYESLTYREISLLMGEEKPTFKLLAFLTDIRGFIHTERNHRGNLLTISHQDWKKRAITKFEDEMKVMINNWAKLVDDSDDMIKHFDWLDEKNDGWTYLSTYLEDYLDDFKLTKHNFNAKKHYDNILVNRTLASITKVYQKQRRHHIQTNEIRHLRQLIENGERQYERELADSLYHRSILLRYFNQDEKAHKDLNEAISIYQNNSITTKDKVALACLLTSRGTLADCIQAESIFESLTEEELSKYEEEYADVLSGKGNTVDNPHEALIMMDQALEIYTRLKENDHLYNQDSVPRLLYEQAIILSEKLDFNNVALSKIDEAISMIEEMERNGKRINANLLAAAFSIRGDILFKENLHEAMNDFEKGNVIMQNLGEQGSLPEDLMNIPYENQAYLYLMSDELNEDEIDEEKNRNFFQGVEMLRELSKENEKLLEQFQGALYLRASKYSDQEKYEEAIADYTELIQLLQQRVNSGYNDSESNLADAFINRGLCYLLKLRRLKSTNKP